MRRYVLLRREHLKLYFFISSCLFISSCAVVAEKEVSKNYNNCTVNTPSYNIKKEDLSDSEACRNAHPACLPVLGIFVPAISTVVSGSIYIVGNTINWLEYQGRCDRETIEIKSQELKDSLVISKT